MGCPHTPQVSNRLSGAASPPRSAGPCRLSASFSPLSAAAPPPRSTGQGRAPPAAAAVAAAAAAATAAAASSIVLPGAARGGRGERRREGGGAAPLPPPLPAGLCLPRRAARPTAGTPRPAPPRPAGPAPEWRRAGSARPEAPPMAAVGGGPPAAAAAPPSALSPHANGRPLEGCEGGSAPRRLWRFLCAVWRGVSVPPRAGVWAG